jgi:hypothetical protein
MFFVINPDPTKASFIKGGTGRSLYNSVAYTNILSIGARYSIYGDNGYPVDGCVYFSRAIFQLPGFYGVPNDSSVFKSTSSVSSGLQIWSLYYDGTTLRFNVNGTQNTASTGSYGTINTVTEDLGLVGYWSGAGGTLPVFGTNGIGEIVFYNTNLATSNNYQIVEG